MYRPYIVGIDEAGRGPIAGPVSVAAFTLFDYSLLESAPAPLRDSKKLSPQKRELWFTYLIEASKKGKCAFAHSFSSARSIDSKGINTAIREALERSLTKVHRLIQKKHGESLITSKHVTVLLDGGLKAPARYPAQTTIIKGDEKEISIMLASIIAKVMRDTYMEERGKEYPSYAFHIHKGYGTRKHYASLQEHGISPLHRKSFLKKVLSSGDLAEVPRTW